MKQKNNLVLFILYLLCSFSLINTIDLLNRSTSRKQLLHDKIIKANSEIWENNGAVSFMEIESKEFIEDNINAELLIKLESDLKAQFLSQMNNGRKRRYTEDGRLCAAAFVQDGQTYNDCTSARSPDGEIKKREWCYVNPGEKGKVWDYCRPVMNYDKVREANQNVLRKLTVECRKVQDEIEVHVSPAEDALNDLKKTRVGQADLDNKVNLMIRDVETINNNMLNLYSIKSQWETEEVRVVALENQINKKREKMNVKNTIIKEYYDNSDETLRSQSLESNQRLSGHLQRRLKTSEKCCDGMLLYEESKEGDGLKGQYYDNEAWLGNFVERNDDTINFTWTGASPKKGINQNNFSVKWSGYLHAPYSGKYTLAIECDDGASLSINNELIISHNMHTAAPEDDSRTDRWLTNEINKRANPNKNHLKSISQKIHLTGGNKFKIVVSYFHSVHDVYTEVENTFVRLTWATEEWEEQVIPKKFLFTRNAYAPLKITGFPPESAVVRNLHENDLAFRNSKTYILQDIPSDYLGAPTLKFNTRIKTNSINFYVNAPVIIYTAFLAHYPNPLPDDFENTQQSMSLIQIESRTSKNQTKFLARRSGMMKIFKRAYPEGNVSIPLKSNGFNVKGVPLALWLAFDSNAGGPVTCGGNEFNISNSNGPAYDSCKSSSVYPGSYCSHAFNEKMRDNMGEMWFSGNEGVGAWIEVKFKQLFLVMRLEYKDRKNPLERNSILELKFDNGSTQTFNLRNLDDIKDIAIEPVKTTSVRITIKGVFGTINNGGAFRIMGAKCTNIDKEPETVSPNKSNLAEVTGVKQTNTIPALFRNDEKEMIKVRCMDSISNSKKFSSINKTVGSKVLIYCAETCALTDFSVYGDLVYAKDSAICRSAFHSQRLSAEGGKVWLIFQNGRSGYRAQMRNGVRSEGKSKSDTSYSFEGYFKEEDIIMEVGSKIDIANPYKPGWTAGVIIRISIKDINNKQLQVAIEGVAQSNLTMNYPDKTKIAPCGDYVPNRDCKGSRRSLNKKVPIKIRFTPEDYYEDGNYLPDYGKTFGFNNKPYGWNKDMTGSIRQFNEASKQELHSFVEFPPSIKSKICRAPNSQCDNATWSVKVGTGRFFVRLYVGDPENKTKVDLMVNNVPLAKNKIVNEDELKLFEGVIEAKNEFLVVSNNCKENCDLSNAKLNAIEFTPYEEKPKKAQTISSEIPLSCGHAFRGGRCDNGPDVLHCLFDDPSKEVAGNCTGALVIMLIPSTYQCRDQIGKYKCMKKVYDTEDDCNKFCVNNCKKNQCIG